MAKLSIVNAVMSFILLVAVILLAVLFGQQSRKINDMNAYAENISKQLLEQIAVNIVQKKQIELQQGSLVKGRDNLLSTLEQLKLLNDGCQKFSKRIDKENLSLLDAVKTNRKVIEANRNRLSLIETNLKSKATTPRK